MSDFDDVVRRNPKAAAGMGDIKSAIRALDKLRKTGIAKGPTPLAGPHSGRYGELPRPTRKVTAALKMTF